MIDDRARPNVGRDLRSDRDAESLDQRDGHGERDGLSSVGLEPGERRRVHDAARDIHQAPAGRRAGVAQTLAADPHEDLGQRFRASGAPPCAPSPFRCICGGKAVDNVLTHAKSCSLLPEMSGCATRRRPNTHSPAANGEAVAICSRAAYSTHADGWAHTAE